MVRRSETMTKTSVILAGCIGLCAGRARAQYAPAPQNVPQAQQQATDALKSLPSTDQAFVRQAVGALLAQTRFGQLAAQNASSPQVRQIGQMIADQGTQIMQRLHQSANDLGVTLPPAQMTPKQLSSYQRLSQLKGPAFDEAYMEEVQALQQQTQASFLNEMYNGESPALQRFATQTLPTIKKNADQIQRQFSVIRSAPQTGQQPMPQP
jgi:predicted outer membrane protein